MLSHPLITAGCITLLALPVQAQMTLRQVSAQQSQGRLGPVPTLDLSPTWGLTLSFIATGERIQQVRVGDPSRILVDFDSPLSGHPSGHLSGGGATVIYLRQLGQPLDLGLRLPIAAQNSPQVPLTVVTTSAQGRKLYQFRLLLGQETSVSTVEVVPEASIPRAQPQPQPVRLPNVPPRPPLPPL